MTIYYFEKIKKRITELEWLIERERIDTEYDEDADISKIGGNIVFMDGSVLHFKEIFIGQKMHYRFHYMDEKNNLITRWDNAPHHKELSTFPHHVHLPDGVKENKSVKLIDVLDKIENIVIENLG
ncbi:hypothetical protein SCALIN_C45_0118 [Candidatus Scalindua japonica]|uniref:Uncharacterized protein n=1 Tax=Candidatus Scalindua japonica TaxID=1284222 RepID=A0A286U476_9BACT|nr:DUF6516 family protein [Candidatus Scalindua japonica]GAX62960.1 hypothetical protein SCALIN_C45_0118 [Candidatus Scalindua japonica]